MNTQRKQFELWNDGAWIHWEELDEDLSADGFLTFQKESYIYFLHKKAFPSHLRRLLYVILA